MTATLHFSCLDRDIANDEAARSILDIAIAQGVPHWRECGGNGQCTTCRVRILDGLDHVTPRTTVEERLAAARDWDRTIRLACQMRATGDVTMERLVHNGADASHLQVETVRADTGEERSLAILFCDMRNFTPFVESHSSYDVVHILNRLFATLGEPILMNNGIIYQNVGDEITGLFGLDGAMPERSCRNAVRAAVAMTEGLRALNTSLEDEFGLRLAIGVGIHYGPVTVGRVGHPDRKHLSVLGDNMDAASQIGNATERLGSNVLLSQAVLDILPPDLLNVGRATEAPLRGRNEAVTLFEVNGFTESDPFMIAQATAGRLLSEPEMFSTRFYSRLFEAAPDVESMFRNNMRTQGQMLEHMLRAVVYALGRPEHLAMGLHALGQRHVRYGVNHNHYSVIRAPLLDTIGEILGEGYTPAVAEAWEATIDVMLDLMQRGATGQEYVQL